MAKRRCRSCPRLVEQGAPQGRCPSCRSEREAARGTRQERGYDAAYDAEHRAIQRRLDAGEQIPCWRCTEAGTPHYVDPRPGHWHLGHDDLDRTKLLGPECPSGNLRAAAIGLQHPTG